MSTEIENKKLTLKSSDGEVFEVDEAVALHSQTIKHMMEDGCADNAIPLTGVILAKVIEYLKKHAEDKEGKDQKKSLKRFDANFVDVEQSVLTDLILAANHLKIKKLWDLTCQTVADKYPLFPEFFDIMIHEWKDDLTPEEEEVIRKEYQWTFE